jgi:hypothetical protein
MSQQFFRDLDALEGVSFEWRTNPRDMKVIVFEGGVWAVAGEGVLNDRHETFCHLVSLTEGWERHDGWRPKQIGAWVEAGHLARGFYRFEAVAA